MPVIFKPNRDGSLPWDAPAQVEARILYPLPGDQARRDAYIAHWRQARTREGARMPGLDHAATYRGSTADYAGFKALRTINGIEEELTTAKPWPANWTPPRRNAPPSPWPAPWAMPRPSRKPTACGARAPTCG